jgi:hypothetical protein
MAAEHEASSTPALLPNLPNFAMTRFVTQAKWKVKKPLFLSTHNLFGLVAISSQLQDAKCREFIPE